MKKPLSEKEKQTLTITDKSLNPPFHKTAVNCSADLELVDSK
ncbi:MULTISPECIES: hypothetical protein [Flavobacterium]|nr:MULTISPECIES: hypothetical protein [Flavobacterium]